ncbi:MAG: nuclear transport factor 2 family protein [Acidimicrobiales bacterium]|jgi:hypothetical protein
MGSLEDLMTEVAALRTRVAVTEGVLAVQALKARYAELVDLRFSGGDVVDADTLRAVAEAVAALFTPDGVWDGGPSLGAVVGRDAIAARLADPTLVFSRHLFVNPRITVDAGGVTATGRWDLLSPCRRPDGSSYWMCGYENDEYALIDGAWLHRSMKLTTVFMSRVGGGWTKILV